LSFQIVKQTLHFVTAKEIERTCNKLGQQTEAFFNSQAAEALKVVPLQVAPKLYVCMDGTGVPMVKKELLNRQGKAEDGQAKTREVKLGCLFTQTKLDEKGGLSGMRAPRVMSEL